MSGRWRLAGRRFGCQQPADESGCALRGGDFEVAGLAAEHFQVRLVVAAGEVRPRSVEGHDVIDLGFEGDRATAGAKPAGQDATAFAAAGANLRCAARPDPLVVAVVQAPALRRAVEDLSAGNFPGADPAGASAGKAADFLYGSPCGHQPRVTEVGPRRRSIQVPPVRDGRRSNKKRLRNFREPFVGEMEAPVGFEPAMELLQSSALPLGHGALCNRKMVPRVRFELTRPKGHCPLKTACLPFHHLGPNANGTKRAGPAASR